MEDIAGEGCQLLIPFNERKPLADIERKLDEYESLKIAIELNY